MRKLNRLLTAALLLAAACASKTVPLQIKIATNLCGKSNPLQDVTHVRTRVLGEDGQHVSETVNDVATGAAALEGIPSGRKLKIEVAGFIGAPPDGKLVSFGASPFFLIPDVIVEGQQPVKVHIFLRPVEKFSPVVSAENPDLCTALSVPRAGHTATLLDDGRVLIAGGFDAKANVNTDWTYRDTVDVLDPVAGTISTESPPMQVNARPTPRGFHTATKLSNGQVLVAGGEQSFASAGKRAMATLATALLFDATADSGHGAWIPTNMNARRSHHTATLHSVGGHDRVLVIGGLEWNGSAFNLIDTVEWFDPESNIFKKPTVSAPMRRVGHSAIAVLGSAAIAVVGGNNGTKQYDTDGIRFYQLNKDNEFTPSTAALELKPARSFASAALIGDGLLLALGGFQSLLIDKPTNPFAGSDLLTLKGKNGGAPLIRSDGPSLDLARGHICSVTMKDGRVLAIGGRGRAGADDVQESLGITNALTELNGVVTSAKVAPLADARYFHTCTVLQDGSVLVTGGIAEKGGAFGALSSMEIFMPAPPPD